MWLRISFFSDMTQTNIREERDPNLTLYLFHLKYLRAFDRPSSNKQTVNLRTYLTCAFPYDYTRVWLCLSSEMFNRILFLS
jgi:hypothetical protein